jgi:GT2 family glycosyltransferase
VVTDKIKDNVVAVVVNWNAGVQLNQCLHSLQNQCSVVVVDNASTDGSCDGISAFTDVTLVVAGENLGFGKACNLGASKVQTEYVLFLNPDAALFPGTLDSALSLMQAPEHARVGICGVQLVGVDGFIGQSCSRFPSPWKFVAQSIGLDRLVKRWGPMMTDWSHDATQAVDQVMGAFFLVRRDLFGQLGGFDERFFLYFEEVDFCHRAKQLGWTTMYLADVQAFHKGAGTSDQVKARRLFYVLRSRLLYAHKHFSRGGVLAVLMATLLVEPFSRSALALIRRSWPELKETWQGYGMLLRWLPAWVFKGVTR